METEIRREPEFYKGAFGFVDLFCGAGGFSLGFAKAGFAHLAGVDNWQLACDVYEQNIGRAFCWDIRNWGSDWWEKQQMKYPYVVIGSPPCQTFSKANIKSRECDVSLVAEFFRVVKLLQPKVWVMENVPEVESYITAPHKYIFDLSQYGLLQRRHRFFCSNIPLHPSKPVDKYLDEDQLDKLVKFRTTGIHRKFGTLNCRYNSFGRIQPHFEDEQGVKVPNHEEAMAIQSFPFDFNIPDHYNQREIETLIGNAVPPMFAYKLAKCALEYLETGEGKTTIEPGVRKAVQKGFFD